MNEGSEAQRNNLPKATQQLYGRGQTGTGARSWLHPTLLFPKLVWPSRSTVAFIHSFIYWSTVDLTVAFVKHTDSKALCQLYRIWISRALVSLYVGKVLRICMLTLHTPSPSQVILMTWHVWKTVHWPLLSCSDQSLCPLWGSPPRGSPTKCLQLVFMTCTAWFIWMLQTFWQVTLMGPGCWSSGRKYPSGVSSRGTR